MAPDDIVELFSAFGPVDVRRMFGGLGIYADGTMFAADIGMNHIEEINIVKAGGNYGWMKREGYFENGITRPGGALKAMMGRLRAGGALTTNPE